jgi:hypothetical protein
MVQVSESVEKRGIMEGSKLIDRAMQTLLRNPNAALATVTRDGRPWNSPVFVAFDPRLRLFWSSRANAVHSANIRANAEVVLVIFDSASLDESGHAVYVQAHATELSQVSDVERAARQLAARQGKPPRLSADFLGESVERLYVASPDVVWTNVVKEIDGRIHDERVRVDLSAPWPVVADTAPPTAVKEPEE